MRNASRFFWRSIGSFILYYLRKHEGEHQVTFDGVKDSIHSGKLLQQGDTDAGLLYAGSAVTAVLVGVGPIGGVVLGLVLIGGGMVLSRAGDAVQDSLIEKWLDASSFGRRELPGAPRYATLRFSASFYLEAYAAMEGNAKAAYGRRRFERPARNRVIKPEFYPVALASLL